MNKLFLILAITSLACTFTALPASLPPVTPQPAAKPGPVLATGLTGTSAVICVQWRVNVRADAGQEYAAITQLSDNTPVIITGAKLDRYGYKWQAVEWSGGAGYVFDRYVCP